MIPIFLSKFWREILIGVLCLTTLGSCNFWLGARAALAQEKSDHQRTITTFKHTQELANESAKAIEKKLKEEAKKNAKEADTRYANLLSQYNANLLRYKANQSNPSRPSDSSYTTPQSSDRPSSSTIIPATVTITMDDAEICAINTARLQSVQEWAVNLIK